MFFHKMNDIFFFFLFSREREKFEVVILKETNSAYNKVFGCYFIYIK